MFYFYILYDLRIFIKQKKITYSHIVSAFFLKIFLLQSTFDLQFLFFHKAKLLRKHRRNLKSEHDEVADGNSVRSLCRLGLKSEMYSKRMTTSHAAVLE